MARSTLYLMKVLMKMNLAQFETVRTTVTFPAELIQRSQHFVDSGQAPNRNSIIVAALERFLVEMERDEIDRAFYASADDIAYHALNEGLAEAFADNDWEALTQGEQALS